LALPIPIVELAVIELTPEYPELADPIKTPLEYSFMVLETVLFPEMT
jgi:hypothetical protein